MYDPILYLSDFWQLRRDMILADDENLERIQKVRDGETFGDPENQSEAELKNLNWDGKIKLTWDNYSIVYFMY